MGQKCIQACGSDLSLCFNFEILLRRNILFIVQFIVYKSLYQRKSFLSYPIKTFVTEMEYIHIISSILPEDFVLSKKKCNFKIIILSLKNDICFGIVERNYIIVRNIIIVKYEERKPTRCNN